VNDLTNSPEELRYLKQSSPAELMERLLEALELATGCHDCVRLSSTQEREDYYTECLALLSSRPRNETGVLGNLLINPESFKELVELKYNTGYYTRTYQREARDGSGS
jgi:hypothetical protein